MSGHSSFTLLFTLFLPACGRFSDKDRRNYASFEARLVINLDRVHR